MSLTEQAGASVPTDVEAFRGELTKLAQKFLVTHRDGLPETVAALMEEMFETGEFALSWIEDAIVFARNDGNLTASIEYAADRPVELVAYFGRRG